MSKIKHYNFPIRKPFKSTDLSRCVNSDNVPAETMSSGNDFQTVIMRTAKKCCLQLTLESGKNNLKRCPRVARLRTLVKDHQTTIKRDHEEFYNIILNQRVAYEVPNDRFRGEYNDQSIIVTM